MRTILAVTVLALAGCGEMPGNHSFSCSGSLLCPGWSEAKTVSDSICAPDETDARLKMNSLHPTQGSCTMPVDCVDTGKGC